MKPETHNTIKLITAGITIALISLLIGSFVGYQHGIYHSNHEPVKNSVKIDSVTIKHKL